MCLFFQTTTEMLKTASDGQELQELLYLKAVASFNIDDLIAAHNTVSELLGVSAPNALTSFWCLLPSVSNLLVGFLSDAPLLTVLFLRSALPTLTKDWL